MENKLNNNQLSVLHQMINSKESKRFSIISFFNNHLILIQDFNRIETPYLSYSHSNDDEHNNIISICILFWSAEISWNGRKERKQ
jgi:hypothetical protein